MLRKINIHRCFGAFWAVETSAQSERMMVKAKRIALAFLLRGIALEFYPAPVVVSANLTSFASRLKRRYKSPLVYLQRAAVQKSPAQSEAYAPGFAVCAFLPEKTFLSLLVFDYFLANINQV